MKNHNDLIGFITFSGYSSPDFIELMVQRHHAKWVIRYPKWSYESTKLKLLSAYWSRLVTFHFIAIFSLILIVGFLFVFRHENATVRIAIISSVTVITFITLRLFVYSPIYMNEYVPLLNNAIETLSGDYLKEIDDVKKAQYSAITIVLIHIVTNKLGGFPVPAGNKIPKDEMAKLYGISERSFHDALNSVINADWKPSKRMDTEMADAFKKAGQYFSATGNMKAVSLLSDIQTDLLVSKKPPAI